LWVEAKGAFLGRLQSQLYGFDSYTNSVGTLYKDYGIMGYPLYQGSWTVRPTVSGFGVTITPTVPNAALGAEGGTWTGARA
jgi:hypothetical protein